jgi:hypothetical protein
MVREKNVKYLQIEEEERERRKRKKKEKEKRPKSYIYACIEIILCNIQFPSPPSPFSLYI